MWGAGNYAAVAEKIGEVGEACVERAGVEPGMTVLDVACGTGNATLPAVRAGARVTGLDFQPDLLATARERAADAMLEVDWVEADAQALPFPDRSFDRVLSTFGHMFAPDHERVAAEMKRVCRGRIAICCWAPDGAMGRLVATIAELVPPPAGSTSPLLWGTEEHVRALLGDGEFEPREVVWRDESPERYADFMLESFGPLLDAREALGGRAGELRRAFVRFLRAENTATDGSLRFAGEYLMSVVDI
jgi:SAM-dependent methyltransferase